MQSLQRLQRVDLGFDPADLTTGMMGLPPDRFTAPDSPWDGFYKPLLERLASAPGVEAVAMSSGAPFGGGNTGMPIDGVGETRMGSASLQTDWRMVSPGYFTTIRIPLLRGRHFEPSGTADANTLIVSATMARQMWGEADPIGRQIQAGPNVGILGAIGVSRWIGSLLFEMRARDPWTIAAAAVAVGAIAVVASYIPARRATRVDPLLALRAE